MKQILHHLKEAHKAVAKGNIKRGRYHIGHALAASNDALRAPANAGMSSMSPEEQNPNEPEPDTDEDDTTMATDHWMQNAVPESHKGLLHKKLGVPQDENIPAGKLTKAIHSSSPILRHEAQFAKTAGGLSKLRARGRMHSKK